MRGSWTDRVLNKNRPTRKERTLELVGKYAPWGVVALLL